MRKSVKRIKVKILPAKIHFFYKFLLISVLLGITLAFLIAFCAIAYVLFSIIFF